MLLQSIMNKARKVVQPQIPYSVQDFEDLIAQFPRYR